MPAKYDPDRLPNGTFVKGNAASRNNGNMVQKKLNSLREMWYDCSKPADMQEVYGELLKIVRECPVWDVKLKAAMYYIDRQIGKPTERVEMDVHSEGGSPLVNVNLSPEELAVASRIVGRLGGGEPEQLPPV